MKTNWMGSRRRLLSALGGLLGLAALPRAVETAPSPPLGYDAPQGAWPGLGEDEILVMWLTPHELAATREDANLLLHGANWETCAAPVCVSIRGDARLGPREVLRELERLGALIREHELVDTAPPQALPDGTRRRALGRVLTLIPGSSTVRDSEWWG